MVDFKENRLGDTLRGERYTIGLSLEEISQKLKIKPEYITAIEDADLSALPAKPFISGYVKSYARLLGLDEQKILDWFSAETGMVFGVAAAGMLNEAKSSKKMTTATTFDEQLRNNTISLRNREARRISGFSFSGLLSVLVLFGLIAGLGYGGWKILTDVQKVTLAPVDQTPEVGTEQIATSSQTIDATVEQKLAANSVEVSTPKITLEQIYRPQELDVPVLIPRDGPISRIIASEVEGPPVLKVASANSDGASDSLEVDKVSPRLMAENGPETITIVSSLPAWVRVYLDDGSVLFEKILEKGETYVVPADIEAPKLRAGNAGYVYIVKNNEVRGPIGKGTGIAKNISLTDAFIEENIPASSEMTAEELMPQPEVQIEAAQAG